MEQENPTAETVCPDCRALVSDLDQHERWHGRLVKSIATAVEQELKRSRVGG